MINMNTKEKFFSFKGRIRRSAFGIRTIALCIIGIIIYFLSMAIIGMILSDNILIILLLLILLMAIINYIAYLMQIVKRLHDLDKEGIWAILIFVPLVSFIFLLYLIFADGTVGPNRYGEDPKGRTPYNTT